MGKHHGKAKKAEKEKARDDAASVDRAAVKAAKKAEKLAEKATIRDIGITTLDAVASPSGRFDPATRSLELAIPRGPTGPLGPIGRPGPRGHRDPRVRKVRKVRTDPRASRGRPGRRASGSTSLSRRMMAWTDRSTWMAKASSATASAPSTSSSA
jgi:hypothetical protein